MTYLRKMMLFTLFLVLYLISTVPVGLMLYSLKMNLGVNIFEKTGFHAYQTCLEEQIKQIYSQAQEPVK